MNSIEGWISESVVTALGWTLLHFLWQGSLIAVLYGTINVLLQRSSAAARYFLGCASLAMMMVLPAITFFLTQSVQQPLAKQSIAITKAPLPLPAFPDSGANPSTTTEEPRSWSEAVGKWIGPSLPWVVLLWGIGAALLASRLAGGWLYITRLRRQGTEQAPSSWRITLTELTQKVGVSRPVELLRTSRIEVPTVIGWLRPVILVPVSTLSGLSAQQIEAILVHELAHIRRYDYLVNLFQKLVETLLFYHPAVWWISRQIRVERENCCDDWAVRVCGNAAAYARALAQIEELRTSTGLAVSAGGGALLSRVRRLLGLAPRPCREASGLLVAAAVVLATGLITLGSSAFHLSRPTPLQGAPEEIVAKINDEVITWADLGKEIDHLDAGLRARFKDPKDLAERFDSEKRGLLKKMIQPRLLLQKAGELEIGADVDVQVSAYLEYMRKEAGIPDMEGFDQVLRRQGSSLSELRRISREKYIQETVIYELVYANLTVLTPEIEEYYNANMSRFTVPAEVQLAEILLLTEGQDQTRVRSKAEALLAKLRAGSRFEQLAKESSQGSSAAKGGAIGNFKKGSLEPKQEAVAFNLGEGEHSQLIEVDRGFQILKLIRKRPKRQKTLDEARSEIQNELSQQKGRVGSEDFLMRLHRESSIYVAPRYQDEFDLVDPSPKPMTQSSESSVPLEEDSVKEIEEVRIVGNRRIPESTIRYYVKSSPGTVYSSR